MSKIGSLKDAAALIDELLAAPEPTDAKGKTRLRILRAATRLFQEQGYRRTSVDEVGREAGVAKGTVYVHFKDKADLLLNALIEEKRGLVAVFRPLLTEQMAPEERLLRYLELTLVSLARAPLSRRLVGGDREMLLFLEDLSPELRAELSGNQDIAMRELLKGVGAYDQLSPEEQERRAKVLTALMYSTGALMDERVRGGLGIEEYAHTLAKAIVRGIGAL